MDLKEKSYKIFLFSEHYKQMVTNTLEMAIKEKNPSYIISDTFITEKDLIEKTKYCDYSIIYPLLFLFYHWIELILKGFLLMQVKENPKTKKLNIKKIAHHDIMILFKQFKNNYPNEKDIINFIGKYTIKNNMPDFLKIFFNSNKLSVKNYYNFFRYPLDKNFDITCDYDTIIHTGEKGLTFFKDLLEDINRCQPLIVKLGRKITNH
ncbi:MAG: hypothetical protein PHN37_03200 [Candidatus Pacebacteria bacterium]|nr:hypothetical protein [Candidatus Paceibacterota bacterium]